MKKSLVVIVLVSMTLHCASRTGFLDYLYQNRLAISYTLGLIKEIPIAMCNGEYDFGNGFVLHEHQESESTVPQTIAHAQEIQLFINESAELVAPDVHFSKVKKQSGIFETPYSTPSLSIFHPPA